MKISQFVEFSYLQMRLIKNETTFNNEKKTIYSV